ncbi:major facilitator superfamily domain-containing protein [Xylaria bambusicola]|uniref:major facilitator superfamily domain-containing protein n=1 Tax=Xylaria bambusicola TaxID=326684 RepID=UPI0020076693|nr:major facilitator superfamily domain-containing protein [Xylaria bambusicola]KAI0517071.1 major facilitator superfamily domain-containing protein [Xylaria bambusicola]
MTEPVPPSGSKHQPVINDAASCNKKSTGDAESSHGNIAQETAVVVDSAAERALCRKFDFRLLPVLALMYLFNALDKGNLGNAQTAGLSKDLNFKSGQYNLIVGIFFVPYVVFAPPLALLGKKIGPSRMLPILMFSFGSFTLLTAATHNFSGIFALRFFLGAVESAFFPLVIFYLTTFYRRSELARRLAIFYAASNIANAFSGLLAFGVFQIKSNLVDHPWRWLFIIEGTLTVLFAIFVFFYLPKSAAEARFLNEEEKALAYHRIQVDSSSIVNEAFNLKESLQIFKRPSTYGFLLIEIALGVPIQSVALFLPQIVQRIVKDTVKVNLYTVAPNITGAVTLLILAFSSDLLRIRFPFICLGFALSFTGFIIYAAIDDVQRQRQLAYYSTFMMTWGTSAPSVLLSTWYNNNVAHEGQRLTLTSVGVPLANLMGLVSSNVFREQDKPKYEPAIITTASYGGFGFIVAACLGFYMMFDNKRRNRRQGVNLSARDVPTSRLRDGPKVDDFRWFL